MFILFPKRINYTSSISFHFDSCVNHKRESLFNGSLTEDRVQASGSGCQGRRVRKDDEDVDILQCRWSVATRCLTILYVWYVRDLATLCITEIFKD